MPSLGYLQTQKNKTVALQSQIQDAIKYIDQSIDNIDAARKIGDYYNVDGISADKDIVNKTYESLKVLKNDLENSVNDVGNSLNYLDRQIYAEKDRIEAEKAKEEQEEKEEAEEKAKEEQDSKESTSIETKHTTTRRSVLRDD